MTEFSHSGITLTRVMQCYKLVNSCQDFLHHMKHFQFWDAALKRKIIDGWWWKMIRHILLKRWQLKTQDY